MKKEIVISSLSSMHALQEIIKLKDKVTQAEEQNEYVKDLVRGLDDESSNDEILKVRDRIYKVVEDLKHLLDDLVSEDGTLNQLKAINKKILIKSNKNLST